MKIILFISALLLISLSSAGQLPIPSKPFGYRLAPTNVAHSFTIENYIDLGSPASAAYMENFNEFLASLNYSKTYPFQVTYFFYPQPNNTISYWAATGANVVANISTNPNDLWTFVNNILANQKLLNSLVTYTQNSTINAIGQMGLKGCTGITYNQYIAAVNSENYWLYTAQVLGYGISRKVAGAPYAIANGAPVDGANYFNAGDWTNLLEQIGVLTAVEEKVVVTKFSAPIKVKAGTQFKKNSDL